MHILGKTLLFKGTGNLLFLQTVVTQIIIRPFMVLHNFQTKL